jgi:uncharacterized damage-inducible protein DinB
MAPMQLDEAVVILARTPPVLMTLLTAVPDHWRRRDDGPGTWSAHDIVGHLAHAEATDWLPRIRTVLEHGTGVAFDTFDREAMRAGEPESTDQRLARFVAARSASLAELSTLDISAADLDRRGRHPEFGEVTLGQLLATWVAHDLTHLAQVAEVMARHLRADVGPWRSYLPALDRVAEAE